MKFVSPAVTRAIAKKVLLTEKNAPAILFSTGVAGMVGSTVLACRATLKVQTILDKAQSDLEIANTMQHPDYSEKDRKKDKAIVLSRTAVDLTILYGPAVVVGAMSLAALTRSHQILSERNAALVAAYTTIDKAFNRYRERVVEKYGREEDAFFRHGLEEIRYEDENGKTETGYRVSDEAPSMYARFFDQLSPQWSKEPEYNLVFLRCQQQWANDMLKTRGHIFLNEVYDNLGIPRTKAGQVVGWTLAGGDNFVDFGIYGDGNSPVFVNGREGAILLDFNVDGIIYDKIDHMEQPIRWQS